MTARRMDTSWLRRRVATVVQQSPLQGYRRAVETRVGRDMNTEEYGCAYQIGLDRTVRLLIARGISWDCAQETAQAAWARGWEKRDQLRDSKMVMTWVNTIALNMYRSSLRR